MRNGGGICTGLIEYSSKYTRELTVYSLTSVNHQSKSIYVKASDIQVEARYKRLVGEKDRQKDSTTWQCLIVSALSASPCNSWSLMSDTSFLVASSVGLPPQQDWLGEEMKYVKCLALHNSGFIISITHAHTPPHTHIHALMHTNTNTHTHSWQPLPWKQVFLPSLSKDMNSLQAH